MSRTDKDTPLWVRDNDPTERRYAYHYQGNQWWSSSSRRRCSGECTIETSVSTPRHMWLSSTNRIIDLEPCSYHVRLSRNYHNTPPREARRDLFHGPVRRAERVYEQSTARAYNSGFDVEEDCMDSDLYDAGKRYIKRYWHW